MYSATSVAASDLALPLVLQFQAHYYADEMPFQALEGQTGGYHHFQGASARWCDAYTTPTVTGFVRGLRVIGFFSYLGFQGEEGWNINLGISASGAYTTLFDLFSHFTVRALDGGDTFPETTTVVDISDSGVGTLNGSLNTGLNLTLANDPQEFPATPVLTDLNNYEIEIHFNGGPDFPYWEAELTNASASNRHGYSTTYGFGSIDTAGGNDKLGGHVIYDYYFDDNNNTEVIRLNANLGGQTLQQFAPKGMHTDFSVGGQPRLSDVGVWDGVRTTFTATSTVAPLTMTSVFPASANGPWIIGSSAGMVAP